LQLAPAAHGWSQLPLVQVVATPPLLDGGAGGVLGGVPGGVDGGVDGGVPVPVPLGSGDGSFVETVQAAASDASAVRRATEKQDEGAIEESFMKRDLRCRSIATPVPARGRANPAGSLAGPRHG
jgi:hypothetical protein